MKKKILGMFLVLILVGCLFFVGSGVLLMLAPGLELFGIRYIGGGSSNYYEEQSLSEFEGESIYIDTYGVPINITYTTLYSSKAKFAQNFQGFTKSGYDEADLDVYLDEDNNTHIETKEMVKWLYANESTSDYYLNIELSVVYAMNKNLYINSSNSLVTINGDATYKNFSVSTGDSLVLNGSVTANNITYHSGKKVTIDEKMVATNYDLASTGSSINVTKEVSGDLFLTTKGGDVKFVSCSNLTVTTGGGSVKAYGEGLNSVLNSTSIKTSGGDVILGNVSTINKNAQCKISTNSGEVHISTMTDGEISSDRGKIEIGKCRAVVIYSKVGSVSVDTVSEAIVINGKNGNVFLGGQGSVNNVKVYTTTGKINVKNAYGTVELESVNSTVGLENIGSNNISIIAGRKVDAKGLKGNVYINANGDINANFYGISGDVNIVTGTKTNSVNIDAGKTSYLDVDYNITSSKGKISQVLVAGEVFDKNSKLNSGVHEGRHMIKVKTSYAKVVLKLSI